MPNLRSGYVEPMTDAAGRTYYRARIHLADGSRPRFRVPDEHARSEKTAEAWARWLQAEEDAKGGILKAKREKRDAALGIPSSGETVETWCGRWLTERSARGIGSALTHDKGRLRKYVWPTLGPLEIRKVTRADVERLVDVLDRFAVHDDPKVRVSWKTIGNAWVLVTKMFDDAAHSKRRELRVRDDDPAAGVRGPDRGLSKAKQYVYPSEFLKLVTCPDVDLPFRTLYAAAIYTFARAGELEALTWGDVDLEHGVIHITKSVDRETGKVKPTKTGDTRRIPIEANLRPLLARLHGPGKRRADEAVLWLPLHEQRAALLREHLKAAKIARSELLRNDDQHKHLTFHDLRATGVTWAAVRGDDPLRIKQRAGHKAFTTTEGYIREAENLRTGFGEPFPALPADLVEPTDQPTPVGGDTVSSKNSGGATGDRTRREDYGCEGSSSDRHVDGSPEQTKCADDGASSPPVGPSVGCSLDAIETALAEGIRGAVAAGRFDVVAQLARELEARRGARAATNVVELRADRSRGRR